MILAKFLGDPDLALGRNEDTATCLGELGIDDIIVMSPTWALVVHHFGADFDDFFDGLVLALGPAGDLVFRSRDAIAFGLVEVAVWLAIFGVVFDGALAKCFERGIAREGGEASLFAVAIELVEAESQLGFIRAFASAQGLASGVVRLAQESLCAGCAWRPRPAACDGVRDAARQPARGGAARAIGIALVLLTCARLFVGCHGRSGEGRASVVEARGQL